MVLKTEQERVTTLLRETITLLCRNGLSFSTEFSIEALIGITLDRDDVFLISIKELIQSEKSLQKAAKVVDDANHGSVSEDSQSSVSHGSTGNYGNRSQGKRKRRKHSNVKREGDEAGYSSLESDHDGNESDMNSRVDDEAIVTERNDSRITSQLKQEEGSDMESADEVVFVKQEMDSRWPDHEVDLTPELTDYAEGYGDPGTLSASNLVPVGNMEGTAIWNHTMMTASSAMSIHQGGTSTVTSDGTATGQQELWLGRPRSVDTNELRSAIISAAQGSGIWDYAPQLKDIHPVTRRMFMGLFHRLMPSATNYSEKNVMSFLGMQLKTRRQQLKKNKKDSG